MSWSEVSRRYVDTPPEFYTPEVWRKKADDKKQGSSDEVVDWLTVGKTQLNIGVHDAYQQFEKTVSDLYRKLLKAGVAPEQARMVLPQSMYTEWVWTGTLLSWVHFYKQRTDSHAQKEIQEFAEMFDEPLEGLYPVSWQALKENYTP
jgi:thymidylate synthase (FAD)